MATWKSFTLRVHKPLEHSAFYNRRDSLLEFINHANTVHSTIKFSGPNNIHWGKWIKYQTTHQNADRHMYLNFGSEHSMSLKNQYLIQNSSDSKEYMVSLNTY